MPCHPYLRGVLLALVAVGLVLAPRGGGHFHLCLDGRGPAIAYHADEDTAADHGVLSVADTSDRDYEVAVFGGLAALAGQAENGLPAPLVLAAFLLALLFKPVGPVRPFVSPVPRSNLFRWHPSQPRAPPAP